MTSLKTALTAFVAALLLGFIPSETRAQTEGNRTFAKVLFDQLEYAPAPDEQPVALEAVGYVGGDFNRLWLRAEGEQSTLERRRDRG